MIDSKKYAVYAIGAGLFGGDKLAVVCDNLLDAKRWVASHIDSGHYDVINSGMVLFHA